jgi:hypothetical protein
MCGRGLAGGVLGEETPTHKVLEAGIEGAVRESSTPAEQRVDLLAELVPVHRCVVEQAQHGQLQSIGTLSHAVSSSGDSRTDVSS